MNRKKVMLPLLLVCLTGILCLNWLTVRGQQERIDSLDKQVTELQSGLDSMQRQRLEANRRNLTAYSELRTFKLAFDDLQNAVAAGKFSGLDHTEAYQQMQGILPRLPEFY